MSHPLYAAPKKSKQPTEVPHTTYQIDFQSVRCGKMVAASKRRIRFKFGYTNIEALSTGATGTDCRGSEHELVITWSLSSGKQSVVLDGKEMYFDVGDTTKVKCTFKDKEEHTLQVLAHAAPISAKQNPDPDWRQYDLLIDGISYFRYPKIYQLGVFPSEDALKKIGGGNNGAFTHPNYENRQAAAGPGSTEYGNGVLASVLPVEEKKVEVADLLSFDESETAAVVVAPVQGNHYAVPSGGGGLSPAPAMTDFSANQFTSSFGGAPSVNNYFAQPITPNDNNMIASSNNNHVQQQQQQPPPPSTLNNQYYQNPFESSVPSTTNQQLPATNNFNQSFQGMSMQTTAMMSPQTNPFDVPTNTNAAPTLTNNFNQSFNQETMPTIQPSATYTAPPQQENAVATAAAPVTPNSSSQALVPSAAPANTTNNNMSNLVNLDNLLAPTSSTIVKEAPKPPQAMRVGGQKKPIMNSFVPQQHPQQQGMMYGQQQQGMMYGQQQQQMGYQQPMGMMYQQQPQPMQQPQMQYPQQGYGQTQGFQQSGY
eukprot:scaffold58585_cov65-Cyclotella_meneghiniana.AAC.1